ncbi:hypothetical protein DFS34DRAFT_588970 [Phlyctochytrium arcticum]|nr:hypothetical protein DFS34DRAFT_588970 [Phlyctochytrium arcticum]
MAASEVAGNEKDDAPNQQVPPTNQELSDRWLQYLTALIHTGDWIKLERVTNLLSVTRDRGHHIRPTHVLTPGINYIEYPFQGQFLRNLFLKVEQDGLSVSNLFEHLAGRKKNVWKSDLQITQGDERSLEVFTMAMIYLRSCTDLPLTEMARSWEQTDKSDFLGIAGQFREADQETLQDSLLGKGFWRQSFSRRNLRFRYDPESKNETLEAQQFWTGILERARLRQLRADGVLFYDPEHYPPSLPPQLLQLTVKELGLVIAASFYSVMEFADWYPTLALENLRLLAHYGRDLPVNWFSSAFLKTLLTLLQGSTSDAHWSRAGDTASLIRVFSFWLQKTVPIALDEIFTIRQLGEIAQHLCFLPQTDVYTLADCVNVLGRSIGHVSSDESIDIFEAICSGLRCLPFIISENRRDIYASLEHLLTSTFSTTLASTLGTKISAAWHTPAYNGLEYSEITLDDATIYMEFVRRIVLKNASPQNMEVDGWFRKYTPLRWITQRPVDDTQDRWIDPLVLGLTAEAESDDPKSRIMSIMALTGAITAFQEMANSEKSNKSILEPTLSNLLEEGCWKRFEYATTLSTSAWSWDEQHRGQLVVAYACGEVFGSQYAPGVDRISAKFEPLLESLAMTLFTDETALPFKPSFISELLKQIQTNATPSSEESLYPIFHRKVSKQTQSSIFSQLGKISRAIGLLIEGSVRNGNYEPVVRVMDIMRAACQELFNEVETAGDALSSLDKSAVQQEPRTLIWQYLKTYLFVTVVIARSFTDALYATPTLSDPSRTHAQSAITYIMETFSYVHFVTAKFGLGGFETWQEVVKDLVAWMAEEDIGAPKPSNVATSAAVGANSMLEAIVPEYKGLEPQTNPITRSRTLFFLILSRHLCGLVSEGCMTDIVLPRAYPYLTITNPDPSSDENDMFEMSHSLCVGFIQNAPKYRTMVGEFAPWYAQLLVENFPTPIDYDLLRRTFALVIKSLATYSSPRRKRTARNKGKSEKLQSIESLNFSKSNNSKSTFQSEDDTDSTIDDDADNDFDSLGPTEESVLQDQEGDFISWTCLIHLLNRIHRLGKQISSFEPNAPVEEATSTPRDSPEIGTRLQQILELAGPTELILVRDQLIMILFDQIRTVSLRNLPALLTAVQDIMLGQSIPFLSSVADDVEVVQVSSNSQISNPDNSVLWKALFDAVSHTSGFDYTRREEGVAWYLKLLAQARKQWSQQQQKSKKRPAHSSQLSKEGHTHHEGLRAKL